MSRSLIKAYGNLRSTAVSYQTFNVASATDIANGFTEASFTNILVVTHPALATLISQAVPQEHVTVTVRVGTRVRFRVAANDAVADPHGDIMFVCPGTLNAI